MQVIILGSGTSTGVPVIGCSCEVCTSADPKHQRTRASLWIRTAKGNNIVIDTGPDFRFQVLREKIPRLDAVFYTHLHADHCHGFDDLRAFHFKGGKNIACYLAKEFREELMQRFAYAFSNTGYAGIKPQVDLTVIPNEGSFGAAGEVIETFRVEHGGTQTSVFRLGSFAYATDFKAFSAHQIDLWRNKIDVMVASGIHFGSHKSHSTIPETLELFKSLGVRRGIITHLSHEVDYLRDRAKLPAYVDFAYDGMQVDVESTSNVFIS